MFKYMYEDGVKVYEILINRDRTLFQAVQFGAVLLIQISVFVILMKKVYMRKYVTWMLSLRQSINPIFGIMAVLIPISLYFIYKQIFIGDFYEFIPENFVLFVLFFFFVAITEELIFRGYFYKMLIKKNKKLAIPIILFQAVIFTTAHFNNPGNSYIQIGVLFLAGVLLGIIALRGFLYAVVFHFLWNFLQAYFLGLDVSGYRFTGAAYSFQAPAWENSISAGLILLVGIVICMAFYFRDRRKFI